MPEAEVEVDVDLVRALLTVQYPQLAAASIEPLAFGWDNFLFRVGEESVARLPRRAMAVSLLEGEARWLPVLQSRLPLSVPVPFFTGEPGEGYPWPWLLTGFIPGESAAVSEFDPTTCASELGSFLAALHEPVEPGAPVNPYRGTALAERDPTTRERLAALGSKVAGLEGIWADAVTARPHEGTGQWLHGDLHPHNVLVEDGRVSGVVDWGDLTGGDPATDLAVAWMMFDVRDRDRFVGAYGSEDADLWRRARGWAVSLACAFLAHSADNPVMLDVGERTVTRLLRG